MKIEKMNIINILIFAFLGYIGYINDDNYTIVLIFLSFMWGRASTLRSQSQRLDKMNNQLNKIIGDRSNELLC